MAPVSVASRPTSEIGVALESGHPCYFIGFLPEPMPGQTIEDIAQAEAAFLEKVIALHPKADGKPCAILETARPAGAVMLLAALRPELLGPIIVAGSPLSYWQGVHGKYPVTRGLLGQPGSPHSPAVTSVTAVSTAPCSCRTLEIQNPANTLWTKQYNLYSKIDTEASRYLWKL